MLSAGAALLLTCAVSRADVEARIARCAEEASPAARIACLEEGLRELAGDGPATAAPRATSDGEPAAPSVASGRAGAPSVGSERTDESSVASERADASSVGSERADAPSVGSERAGASSVASERAGASSVASERADAPSAGSERADAPSAGSGPADAPSAGSGPTDATSAAEVTLHKRPVSVHSGPETAPAAGALAPGDTAPAGEAPVAPPGADAEPAAEIELGAEQVAAREDSDEENPVVRATVVDFRFVGYRRLLAQLDNGQVWQQIEGDRVTVERGLRDEESFEVEMWATNLGGYRMHIVPLDRTIRVERLR